jgi:uncharacterized protein YbaR (Trm112 family)
MEILCCPMCKGELSLTVRTGNAHEVLEGNLHCGACNLDYPIEDGIPNMLVPGQR